MKKNSIIYLVLVVSLIILLTGCGSNTKQVASAKQTVDGDQIAIMTVDLSDGYSVEFASGAAYFYKGGEIEDSKVIAHAFIITKESYDGEITYFQTNSELEGKFKDLKNGVYSYTTKETVEYFFPSNDDLYMKVVVQKDFLKDADSIYKRFSADADK